MTAAYLLVQVDDESESRYVIEALGDMEHVVTVIDHGPGCCCKNCPWSGDHG